MVCCGWVCAGGVRTSWWVPLGICLGLVVGGFVFSWVYGDDFVLGLFAALVLVCFDFAGGLVGFGDLSGFDFGYSAGLVVWFVIWCFCIVVYRWVSWLV